MPRESPSRRSMISQPLSRARILAAAVRLGDRAGVEAITMRALGQELGVEAMSLYHHLPNKAAVLEGIVGVLYAELSVPRADALPWPEWTRTVCRSYRALAHRHPALFHLVVGSPLSAPEAAPTLGAGLEVFRRAGFSDRDAVFACLVAATFVEGFVLNELGQAGRPLTGSPIELDPRKAEAAFSFGVDAVVAGLRAKLTPHQTEG
ncbi:MAG: TetR/AcrR family transcriptional regulator C-terminal domain-containing protein [Gemmatimonadales bacterium]|nr:TetR/AcrR family transcriptional regulator C-terminal domain-containing protein [Gemmatimonadales bacterium]